MPILEQDFVNFGLSLNVWVLVTIPAACLALWGRVGLYNTYNTSVPTKLGWGAAFSPRVLDLVEEFWVK